MGSLTEVTWHVILHKDYPFLLKQRDKKKYSQFLKQSIEINFLVILLRF